MDMGGRLKSSYKFLEPILGDFEPGNVVSVSIAWFTTSTIILCVYIQYWFNIQHVNWIDVIFISILVSDLLICKYKINIIYNVGHSYIDVTSRFNINGLHNIKIIK